MLEAQATKNSDVITLSAAEYMNNGIHEPVGLTRNKNAQSQLLWARRSGAGASPELAQVDSEERHEHTGDVCQGIPDLPVAVSAARVHKKQNILLTAATTAVSSPPTSR